MQPIGISEGSEQDTGDVNLNLIYRIAGIFQGVKFSWMLGFVVIRGKTFVVR